MTTKEKWFEADWERCLPSSRTMILDLYDQVVIAHTNYIHYCKTTSVIDNSPNARKAKAVYEALKHAFETATGIDFDDMFEFVGEKASFETFWEYLNA